MRVGRVLSVLGLGLLAGGMLFFGAVMAPLVFTKLPMDIAGPFIRTAFPFLYSYMLVTSVVALVGYGLQKSRAAWVPLLVILATLWSWFWLMPQLDAWRLAGNKAAFATGHEVSTWVFGAALVATLALLIREGARRVAGSLR